jgi:hypothetical protein
VIDLSGDGEENQGGNVPGSRDAALAVGIDTINAISIDDPGESVRQFYQDNAIGGTGAFAASADDFADFETEILAKLNAEIRGIPLDQGDRSDLVVARSALLLMIGGMFEDINGRLFRNRSGFRDSSALAVAGSWAEPEKGGMSKEVLPPPPGRKAWEAFGSVGLYHNDVDGINALNVAGAPQVVVPGYEMTVVHGTVGLALIRTFRLVPPCWVPPVKLMSMRRAATWTSTVSEWPATAPTTARMR